MASQTQSNPSGELHAPGGSAPVRWLIGLALITASSWCRWLATGSLRIDENYPSELAGSLLYATMLGGWVLVITAWVGFLQRPPSHARRLAYTGLLVVALMLPLLSNDVFGLFAYAGLAVRGQDIYGSVEPLQSSPWFLWIGERWRAHPSPYGILGVFSASFASVFGEARPALAIFLLRLTWAFPLLAVMEWSFRRLRDRPFFHAMVWLNPVLLVEGVGQLHLDLLGCLAITAGLLAQTGGRRWRGAVGLGIATLCKWNDIFAAPGFWWWGASGLKQRLKSLGILGTVLLAMTVAAYWPLWRGDQTLKGPVRALFAQTIVPAGSVVDALGWLGNAIYTGGDRFDPNMPVLERVAREKEVRKPLWQFVQGLMWLLSLGALLPLARRVSGPLDDESAAVSGGIFIVIMLTLASPKFESWYLMSALPFFGWACPAAWRRWWGWMVFAAVAKEFPLALPRTAWLFKPAVGISMLMTAVVMVSLFPQRFWQPPKSERS